MVCLGLEPGAAGWKAQTDPLSYCGTPSNYITYSILETRLGLALGLRHDFCSFLRCTILCKAVLVLG